MEGVFILGVDPGFAFFGLSVVQLLPDAERIVWVDVIRTQKTDKKREVRAADDNFHRAQVIAAELHAVVKQHCPVAIAAEAASDPRNASAAGKIRMAWGVLADLCYVYQLPLVQVSPQDIKKALCGDKSASKEEVRAALEGRYSGQFDVFKARFPPARPPKPNGQWEHGFDATGAVVTCLDSQVIRMARGMSGAKALEQG